MYNKNAEKIINEVFSKLVIELSCKNYRKDTVGIFDVHLTFDPNIEYIDFGNTKPTSRNYVNNELEWYKSMDLNINNHVGIENNPIWKSCASKSGNINSNYGKLVYGKQHDNKSQFDYAVKRLLDDKTSRQSVIIYTRPEIQWECDDDEHAKYDFICTTNTQHIITNDNKLIYIVNMRSNDAIFGLQNDYCWHRKVYFDMFNILSKKYDNLQVGEIRWNAGAMQVYERHYDLLKKIVKEYNVEKKLENVFEYM